MVETGTLGAGCHVDVVCRAGGALEPDVVAYNTVMQSQATSGHLTGMLQTLTALTAASLRPTASTYAILMHTHVAHGAAQSVLDLWHQMLQARVLPSTVCLRSYTLAALRVGDTGAPLYLPPSMPSPCPLPVP